jgi:nicotinate-nucleotide--dimethylbenzimidazole phosphoribosyltransferase
MTPHHGPDPSQRYLGAFEAAVARCRPLDASWRSAAQARSDSQTKPLGALGELEAVAAQPQHPAVAVFAADHGVHAAGVTPWPQEVTAQMVANFVAGGAAINAFARQVGAQVTVVDVGVAHDLPGLTDSEVSPTSGGLPIDGPPSAGRLLSARIRKGTADLAAGPAMSRAEVLAALDVGAGVAELLVSEGADLLVTGDMGIANTTASAAVIAALCGSTADAVTGRGTGIDDATLVRKRSVIDNALRRIGAPQDAFDPLTVLAEVGGLEIVALAGFVVGAAGSRVPVIADGVIALAGVCAAAALAPPACEAVIAGHRSTEPGATVALGHLGLRPLIDLGLRLGEGTGACLAVPLVQAAARALAEMATFGDAQVSEL